MFDGFHSEICPYSQSCGYENAENIPYCFHRIEHALRVFHLTKPIEETFARIDKRREQTHRHTKQYKRENGLSYFILLEIERSQKEGNGTRDDIYGHTLHRFLD